MPEYIGVCEEAAKIGGQVLLDWQGRINAREKAPQDLVTEADLASQNAIQQAILSRFPDHGFLAEEEDRSISGDRRHRWIVDPLDGTVNYVHGVPQFAVSVGLEIDGRLAAGAVWDPIAKECFTAEAGSGAFLNGQRIQVSGVQKLFNAMVVASFPAGVQADDPEVAAFITVLVEAQSLRRTGSAALNLSYVAAGRFDGYWATSTKAWDVAAGILLVQEAGGVVTDLKGGEVNIDRPQFVASATEELQKELRPLVKGERP